MVLVFSASNIHYLAEVVGCDPNVMSLKFFVVPAGLNMSRIKSWDPILENLGKSLTDGKPKCCLLRDVLLLSRLCWAH